MEKTNINDAAKWYNNKNNASVTSEASYTRNDTFVTMYDGIIIGSSKGFVELNGLKANKPLEILTEEGEMAVRAELKNGEVEIINKAKDRYSVTCYCDKQGESAKLIFEDTFADPKYAKEGLDKIVEKSLNRVKNELRLPKDMYLKATA